LQARLQLHATIFKISAAKPVGHPIAKKERMKQNMITNKVCISVAHASATTIGIALCNLIVNFITTKMPAQIQTNQKNGTTVQPSSLSEKQRKSGIDGQRKKYGWSIGS
jgi:ribosomal protein L18